MLDSMICLYAKHIPSNNSVIVMIRFKPINDDENLLNYTLSYNISVADILLLTNSVNLSDDVSSYEILAEGVIQDGVRVDIEVSDSFGIINMTSIDIPGGRITSCTDSC